MPSTSSIFDALSVCQLQLMRLVRQMSAIAGWFVYHHTLLNQQQQLRSLLQPLEPYHPALCNVLESQDFLHDVEQDAIEIQPGIWGFRHIPSVKVAATVYGLKFQEPISGEWAYLIVWSDRPDQEVNLCTLAEEVEAFQLAVSLDYQHDMQQRQTEHCQQILRRIEHQLRNPLAIIHLYAANLYHSLSHETERLQVVAIQDAVQYLSDHLTELLASCQRTQIKTEMCDLRSLIAEVWQGLQLLVKEKHAQLQCSAQSLRLLGDRPQLLQLFENLIHNALCFSPSGGQITVHWQVFHQEVVITVADQGPGLAAAELPQIFQPYYSKRPNGSGLGLAIAQQIVAAHGGRIWADNLPTHGAQFSVVLPQGLLQRSGQPAPPAFPPIKF